MENLYIFMEGNAVKSVYLHFEKGSALKEANSILFIVEHFSEGNWCAEKQIESLKIVSLVNQSTDNTDGSIVSECRLGKMVLNGDVRLF